MPQIVTGLSDYFARHREADPEYTTYRNYVEDLERLIAADFGDVDHRHTAIAKSVRAVPAVLKMSQRKLSADALADVKLCLERAWGMLRATWSPLDIDDYIIEFNATIPVTGYYSIYHGLLATIAAVSQRGNHSHRTTLNDASTLVRRSLFPWPWSARCFGCPQLGEEKFEGFPHSVDQVHPLETLNDDEIEHRLGALLKSTRRKELDSRFEDQRTRLRKMHRKNLRKDEKRKMDADLAATTVFDILWRIRKKTNYEGADTFVLGAPSPEDAQRFGESLIAVVDSTLMTLETIVDRIVGEGHVATWLEAYIRRSSGSVNLQRHLDAL